MLVEVEMENGTNCAALFMHKLLSDSVGHSVAAFVLCSPASPPPPPPPSSPRHHAGSTHPLSCRSGCDGLRPASPALAL